MSDEKEIRVLPNQGMTTVAELAKFYKQPANQTRKLLKKMGVPYSTSMNRGRYQYVDLADLFGKKDEK